MSQKDYYAILDVSPGAELSIIEASYWRLARRYSATLATDPNAPRLLSDLNEAYEVLTMPQLRGEYDALRVRVAVGAGVTHQPRRRLWRWWQRHAQDEKERVESEKPMAAIPPMESKDPESVRADSPHGSGAQQEMPAREGSEGHQEVEVPKVTARGPSLLRWEMPALQAFVASAGIAMLGGMALAAGADPRLTLILGSIAMFLCLFPWRFGRALQAHLPPINDRRLPDEAKRAAALRESTAAMVSRWRQSAGLLDGSGRPTAAGKPPPPSTSQPSSHR